MRSHSRALASCLILLPLTAQAPPTGMSPDAEMAKLAETDQSDRTLPPPTDQAGVDTFRKRDRGRLAQARALVMQDQLQDPHSFGKAGLIFQHGQTPDDFLVARELAILSCFLKAAYNDFPVLAEDRYLVTLGHLQRFGGDHTSEGGLFPVQDKGDNAVTDALRLDCFAPLLALSRSESPEKAAQDSTAQAMARIQARWKPNAHGPEWITDPASSPASAELTKLEARPSPKGLRARVIALYRADRLFIPDDYRRAASLLMKASKDANDLLLANELAAVAVMRLDGSAWQVFTESWDRFATAIGQPARYGTLPRTKRAESIPPAILRAMRMN